jgi:hypothetical protein
MVEFVITLPSACLEWGRRLKPWTGLGVVCSGAEALGVCAPISGLKATAPSKVLLSGGPVLLAGVRLLDLWGRIADIPGPQMRGTGGTRPLNVLT